MARMSGQSAVCSAALGQHNLATRPGCNSTGQVGLSRVRQSNRASLHHRRRAGQRRHHAAAGAAGAAGCGVPDAAARRPVGRHAGRQRQAGGPAPDLCFQALTDTINAVYAFNAVALKGLSALPGQCANPMRHAQWAMLAGEPDCARAVVQGTAQIDRAGATMTDLAAAVQRMTDIMAEISAASAEQRAGAAQVGSSVSQMDRATQQNAALVEESAATTERLRDQAQHLGCRRCRCSGSGRRSTAPIGALARAQPTRRTPTRRTASAAAGWARARPPFSAQVRVQRICIVRITASITTASTANKTKPQR